MYRIGYTTRFKKDLKQSIKRGLYISILEKTIEILRLYGKLPPPYRPHKLTGIYANCWECHSDLLLVWKQNDTELILQFTSTGAYSDIF
jgi:mRNA interferase YafQ